MKRKIVYIAGKYDGATDKHRQLIDEAAKFFLERGDIPITPTKITYRWDKEDKRFNNWKREDWLEKFCFPLLEKCDAICIATEISEGVAKEILLAEECKIPILYFNDSFVTEKTLYERKNK